MGKITTKLLYILVIPLVAIYVALSIAACACVPVSIIFMVLKLCNVIEWGWFFVIGLPLICGFGSGIIVAALNMWAKK